MKEEDPAFTNKYLQYRICIRISLSFLTLFTAFFSG